MNRFSQKDILRGSIIQPESLNRYAYCINDPVNFVDPSGMRQVVGTDACGGVGRSNSSSSSSRTSNKSTSTSKGNRSSSSAKSSSSTASSARTSTSSSAYRGSYVAPGPVQSTASRVNPYNTMQSTQQAIADAKRAADFANSLAPGSPAAYQAMQDYYETRRLAEQARITNNPYVAMQAVETSQRSVNHVNNVVTGRTPNTYSPYDSHGNVYSYYNSSYDTGYIPSPNAPRIKDMDAEEAFGCTSNTDSKFTFSVDEFKEGLKFSLRNAPKVKGKIMEVIINSVEFSVGVGQGLGASGNVKIGPDEIGGSLQTSANYLEIRLDDGKFTVGQAYRNEAYIQVITGKLGVADNEISDLNGNWEKEDTSFKGAVSELSIGTGVSAYLIVGGSISVSLNLAETAIQIPQLLEEIKEIVENE